MADGKVIYEVRADDSKVASDLDGANSKVKTAAGKLATSAKVAGVALGGALVAAGGAAIKFGSSFETAMAGASTLFGDVNVNTDALNKKMLDLSSATGIAADELGNSLYNALSAGVPATEDMGDAMNFLEKSSKLAKSGFTDIDTAMSATVKTLNAYGLSIEETDRIQKILMQTQNKGIVTVGELGNVLAQVTPTAAAMGVGFDQVGAAIANMTAQGTPAAQATTQLNSLLAELGKSGTEAQKNLEAAAEGTKYAGMSFQDMMGAGVPLNEVLDLMGTYAASNGLSMLDMFSSIEAGKAALANAGDNSAKFSDALSAMGTQTDVVNDAFDKVSDTSAEKFNKILNELKNTAINLFLQMAPLIEQLLPLLSTVLEAIIPPIMKMVESLMPHLLEVFDKLMPFISKFIEKILPVLSELFDALLPPIMELAEAILPALLDAINILLPPFVELIKAILPPLIEIITALMPLIKIVSNLFSETLAVAIESITPIVDALMQVLSGLIKFITGVFSGDWKMAWEGIVELFKGIFNLIPSIVEGILNGAIGLINKLVDGLNGMTEKIGIDAIPNIPKVSLPRFRTGLDFVPSDDFPALLHRGEMVLTAAEASTYRNAENSVAVQTETHQSATSINTLNVYPDKEQWDELMILISERNEATQLRRIF